MVSVSATMRNNNQRARRQAWTADFAAMVEGDRTPPTVSRPARSSHAKVVDKNRRRRRPAWSSSKHRPASAP